MSELLLDVAEPKTAKNRVHLDLHVGQEQRDATVARLAERGGTVLWEGHEFGSSWITMADGRSPAAPD